MMGAGKELLPRRAPSVAEVRSISSTYRGTAQLSEQALELISSLVWYMAKYLLARPALSACQNKLFDEPFFHVIATIELYHTDSLECFEWTAISSMKFEFQQIRQIL